ncbi:MAG: Chain length determinant protein [Mucilaginibacter sp.]|nr:Chain length determinant protein [Mucilaginibacter sp.]
MIKNNDSENSNAPDEVSVRDIIKRLRYWNRYFVSQWKLIIGITVIAACIGLVYALVKKPVYMAESTFVLEEGEQPGLSQYSGLASMVGISLNGSTNGLFVGDNIIELYKSRTMLQRTLLSKCVFNSKPQLLIDRYIDYNHLRDKWSGEPALKNISFEGDTSKLTVLQDSIIFDIAKEIKKKNLAVDKPDKKLSIIDVQVSAKDELFAKFFNQTLVDNVNNFYVSTKSIRALKNLHILQQQTDSVRSILNSSISGAALANDVVPNANPNLSILRAGPQRKSVDVQANGALYAELLKNLELAKVTLRKETPLIQVIDKPDLPLEQEKPGKILSFLVGGIIGLILSVFYVFFNKILSQI